MLQDQASIWAARWVLQLIWIMRQSTAAPCFSMYETCSSKNRDMNANCLLYVVVSCSCLRRRCHQGHLSARCS
jgi:hypothetical protein